MKFKMLNATVPLIAMVATLAACGGGGDDAAGSLTPLSVVPSTLTVTAVTGSPAGVCGAGVVGEVFVYGGSAPYRLDNTSPDTVQLSKTQVDSRGGSFTVTYLGGCFSPSLVVIVDKLDRQVTLTLNNKPAT